jgi:hypothetical protein
MNKDANLIIDMSHLTTTKVIAQTMKKQLIAHMKANGMSINALNQDKYFNPKSGRITIRNNDPRLCIPYADDIDLTNLLGTDSNIPDELTWISECGGNLNLSHNNLSTLEGCPKKVYGDFELVYNGANLLLLGFPQKVDGNINLENTSIKGLKYLPRNVKNLTMINCHIDNLDGCPEVINGNLDLTLNVNLKSLENGPSHVSGFLKCFLTDIENFIYAPINPDFKGFLLAEDTYESSQQFRPVNCWAGFKPAMEDANTKACVEQILRIYPEIQKGVNSLKLGRVALDMIKKLGTYLTIRESKPELDTSIEARKEYALLNPTSLEDYKSKSDTKQYEGIDTKFLRMLKAALLK